MRVGKIFTKTKRMWTVLLTARVFDTVGAAALKLLQDSGCNVLLPPNYGPHKADVIQNLLPGVDATLCSPDQYTAAVLQSEAASKLKVISRWGVGYDSIDIKAATALGIPVAYTPGMLNETVADWTWALLLGVARRVPWAHGVMAQGQWKQFWGHDVAGKTLGIIGCGRIGQAVAKRAGGFDMRVIGYDVVPCEAKGIEFVPLDQLLAESDFVSLHAALTPESRGLIGEAQLKKMKRSAYLINTGRGPLIDEAAVAKALHDGIIAGAALDVFVTEPLAVESPLRSAPNCLLAAHQASFAKETAEKVTYQAAQAIVDFMNGRKPRWVVDPGVYESEVLRVKVV
jgi:glyoxylate reductase